MAKGFAPTGGKFHAKPFTRSPTMQRDAEPLELRLVEFFSGIGGMRLALEAAVARLCRSQSPRTSVKLTSVLSIDTSGVVNRCYLHNFPNTVMQATKKRKRQKPCGAFQEQLRQANIESLKVSDLEGNLHRHIYISIYEYIYILCKV